DSVRPGWIDRLVAWRPRSSAPRRGFQIIRRHVFEQFRTQQAAQMMRRLDAPQPSASTAIARRLGNPKYLKTAGQLASDN
ncbi:MAG: hypothetical protein WDZ48_07430, partial [Pirellulales bacterium]